jgi:hypothetical protein
MRARKHQVRIAQPSSRPSFRRGWTRSERSLVRVKSLTVRGFRAYGIDEQTLVLPSDIAAVWGTNSKGKTSLGEAFEFLLTGALSRRELMASSQDEFADSIRNVHLPIGTDVYVKATIVGADGEDHLVQRLLTTDYGKKQNCQSRLEIDGIIAQEGDLAALGIELSQPPIAAPVLAQHTLSYIFSAAPQNRATYFKALLEVTDLDDLRNDIALAGAQLRAPASPLLAKFDKCAALPALTTTIGALRTASPDKTATMAKLEAAAATLISNAGEPVPATLADRLHGLERIIAEHRTKTFPVDGFKRAELPGWTAPGAMTWAAVDTFVTESEKVSTDTRRLSALFNEVLRVPAVATMAGSLQCPVCGTDNALTPERVQAIRVHVADTDDYRDAEASAKTAFAELASSAAALVTAADAALPHFWKQGSAARRKTGFTIPRLRTVLGTRSDEVLPQWFPQASKLARASRQLKAAAIRLHALVADHAVDMEHTLSSETLRAAFEHAAQVRAELGAAVNAYKTPAQRVGEVLNEILDAQSITAGWQDFVDVATDPEAIRQALIDRRAHAMVAQELETALKQIDDAKEQVLNDKFTDYSGRIQTWWERLRPDEATFFAAVRPRKGAKRTIDFKAGLSPNADRSASKVRDVIAVFSQSQLHCLGLAMFLARAERDGGGFVVLDDPVLSSDEDYRAHFNTTVVEELLKIPIQVIVITQDHKTWNELEMRYRHRSISTAQLVLDEPRNGTRIENTSDELSAKISRATSLARGGHPQLRKESGLQLRDAGERLCKEMLVKEARAKGNAAAALADYDGKVLEWLVPRVEPLLVRDPSHPGKLLAFKSTVNNACHDNEPPSTGLMVQACGEIRYLVKEYLSSSNVG